MKLMPKRTAFTKYGVTVDIATEKMMSTEIFQEQTNIVEFILLQNSAFPFCYDDVRNRFYHTCPKCNHHDLNRLEGDAVKCMGCDETFPDECMLDGEQKDVYEWILVSPYLAEKLGEMGEVVLIGGTSSCYWGRTTFEDGMYERSMIMDGILQEVTIHHFPWTGHEYDVEQGTSFEDRNPDAVQLRGCYE